MTIESRDWTATSSTDTFAGNNLHLTVKGIVVVPATNKVPKLSVASPQGINPAYLILDLSIESIGDIGEDTMTPKSVEFKLPLTSHTQYSDVTIRSTGKEIDLKVKHLIS